MLQTIVLFPEFRLNTSHNTEKRCTCICVGYMSVSISTKHNTNTIVNVHTGKLVRKEWVTRIYLFWFYLLPLERIYIYYLVFEFYLHLFACVCVCVCIYMHNLSSSQDQLKISSKQSNGFQKYAWWWIIGYYYYYTFRLVSLFPIPIGFE